VTQHPQLEPGVVGWYTERWGDGSGEGRVSCDGNPSRVDAACWSGGVTDLLPNPKQRSRGTAKATSPSLGFSTMTHTGRCSRWGGGGCVAVLRGAPVTEDACRPLLDDHHGGTRDSGLTGAFHGNVVLL
jgi:hypothetical protein